MRTLAIDFGEKRIGLAISDEGGNLASPLEVIEASGAEAKIERVVKEEGVGRIVVGIPLNMDGSFGPAAAKAARWGRKLRATLGVELILVDERLSSFEAEQTLRRRKMAGEKLTRQKKKSRLDALAAAGILQAYLDGKAETIEEGRG